MQDVRQCVRVRTDGASVDRVMRETGLYSFSDPVRHGLTLGAQVARGNACTQCSDTHQSIVLLDIVMSTRILQAGVDPGHREWATWTRGSPPVSACVRGQDGLGSAATHQTHASNVIRGQLPCACKGLDPLHGEVGLDGVDGGRARILRPVRMPRTPVKRRLQQGYCLGRRPDGRTPGCRVLGHAVEVDKQSRLENPIFKAPNLLCRRDQVVIICTWVCNRPYIKKNFALRNSSQSLHCPRRHEGSSPENRL